MTIGSIFAFAEKTMLSTFTHYELSTLSTAEFFTCLCMCLGEYME